MIDTKELRRLAQAALTGPDGVSLNWVKLLQDFQKEANPTTVLELLDRLEAVENDASHYKALAESALRVAKGWEDKCDDLRAKIEEMEKQEPLITVLREPDYWSGGHFHKGTRPYISLRQMSKLKIGQKLYTLPGAKGDEE